MLVNYHLLTTMTPPPFSTKRNYVENSFLYQSGSALKQRRKMLSLFRNVYCYQIYIIKRGVANYLACMSASFLFFAVQGCFFLNFCQCFIFRDAFLLFLNTILLSRIRVDGVRRMLRLQTEFTDRHLIHGFNVCIFSHDNNQIKILE